MIIIENGHLNGSCQYHIVISGGLNYPSDFPVTNTAQGCFFISHDLYRPSFSNRSFLAGKAKKLITPKFYLPF